MRLKENSALVVSINGYFYEMNKAKNVSFLRLNSLSKVHLPPLPRNDKIMNSFSLSSSPNHSDCIVIFTGAKLEHETNNVTERFFMHVLPAA